MCGGQLNSFPQCPLGSGPSVAALRGCSSSCSAYGAPKCTRANGTRIPVPPPTAPDRKVPTGSERVPNRRSPREHRGPEKKSKEIPQPWQPPVSPASLTSRTARRERGAGPYTFLPGHSPGASGTRRGRGTRRRAPGARILLSFPPSHADRPPFPGATPVPTRTPLPLPGPVPPPAGPAPSSVQTTVSGSMGRPPAWSLIWISVPIVGHTPQS